MNRNGTTGGGTMAKMKPMNWLGVSSMAIFLLASIAPSHAESYSNLQTGGYKTSKLTRGASGALGWIVSNGEKKFFCRMRVGAAYVGKTGMVGFTSSGRQISENRKVYEQRVGFDPTLPQLSDLKAGRPNARDVGACAPAK
ncbi:MAG: hypothetical protein EOQ40_03430 [Mesorhizobium sp.]|uniref:hypothetical protein n=1 Tax=Mesorhizobium sp. TaxID=1871066 RepID=UPI000FE4BF0C|nr:hypothetical protein [Mesorhizobium sp.]RWB22767.1 MAG: hypothetical protein EOQ40_03430 [Mesorhizobium sp.]